MGKNKRKRSAMLLQAAASFQKSQRNKSSHQTTTSPADGIVPVESSCSAQQEAHDPSELDINVTIRVLEKIAETPDLLYGKPMKGLRTALHPVILHHMNHSYNSVDYGVKVTQALKEKQWPQGLRFLKACVDFQLHPKLGTIQRWVRDCAEAPHEVHLQLLAAILKLSSKDHNNSSNPIKLSIEESSRSETRIDSTSCGELHVGEPWKIPSTVPTDLDNKNDSVSDNVEIQSTVIYHEDAADRTPPNHYDLDLHYVTAISPPIFRRDDVPPPVERHDVPFVSGAFCLSNVLSPRECRYFRDIATKLGYEPHHPTAIPRPTGIDCCEWLISDDLHAAIYQRVHQHLVASVEGHDNAKLLGIHKRFRLFRYGANTVYRPHIDGSWPESRLLDGKYHCDVNGPSKSYYTFLFYLSDDFDGGETRFYSYNNGAKRLEARGVRPREGAALVFPQGNVASLVHEGAALSRGVKYVIRTDVLYSTASR